MIALSPLLALLLLTFQAPPTDNCFDIDTHGVAILGQPVVMYLGAHELEGGGALPGIAQFGPHSSYLSSIATSMEAADDGTLHLTLAHMFLVDDANAFITNDEATCAPSAEQQNVCIVHTRMQVVEGIGIFENASGAIEARGPITISDPTYQSAEYGSLDYHITGRVCGPNL
ncbi:hypothetical protein BH23BAC4_BH23BAC4_08320 [soil metagenome]